MAFLHRDERKVKKTASNLRLPVSFKGNRYTVPVYLRGKQVELRYDPFDLTRIEVWYNNAFLELAEPEEIVCNRRLPAPRRHTRPGPHASPRLRP